MRGWLAALGLWGGVAFAQDVVLVTTGGQRGLGRGIERFDLHHQLDEASRLRIESSRPVHGFLARGSDVLWATDASVAGARAWLQSAAPVTCTEGREVVRFTTLFEAWVADAGDAPKFPADVAVSKARLRRCARGDLQVSWLTEGSEGLPAASGWTLRGGFEHRIALGEEGASSWWQIARPHREPARHVADLQAALAASPGARFVHAGDFVDGFSATRPGRLHLLRDVAWDALRDLDPVALVPGRGELIEGPGALFRTGALPWLASNWTSTDPSLQLPKVIRARIEGRDVAFVGVLDPSVAAEVPSLAQAGIRLTEPVAAVQEALASLAGAPPDVVVLLGRLEPDVAASVLSQLHGVDVFVGDPRAATFRVSTVTTELRQVADGVRSAPLSLPMDGPTVITVRFNGEGDVAAVAAAPRQVDASSPSLDALEDVVTTRLLDAYAGLDRTWVPPTASALDGVDNTAWERLVCEAMLEVSDADVAFWSPALRPEPLPGGLTALQIRQRLATGEEVEVHRVDGDRMQEFLHLADGLIPVVCGASTRERAAVIDGRGVEPERTYHVVTTDRTRRTTSLGALLDAAAVDLVLHAPKRAMLRGSDGVPETLSETVATAIERWSDAYGASYVAGILARKPTDKPIQTVLRARRLALTLERFQGSETDRFAAVPETLLNSPSSFTLGGDLDLAVDVSSAKFAVDARVRAAYTRLVIEDEDARETADDWRLSTSFSVPAAAFPLKAKVRAMPYGEVLYDAEFTPGVDADGATLSRQSDLSFTSGLSLSAIGALRRLRLGAFVNGDMARLGEKLPEFGGRLEAETRIDLLKRSALTLSTLWDVQVFGDTPRDDASDLRLRASGEVRLTTRLVRWLGLSTWVKGLVVQGRVPETVQADGTVAVGAALDFVGAFRLSGRAGSSPP
jgi:hypothetical protein